MDQHLPYSFDLLFDIKTRDQLLAELVYLETRLSDLRDTMAALCINIALDIYSQHVLLCLK
jgi:hypothetical protein